MTIDTTAIDPVRPFLGRLDGLVSRGGPEGAYIQPALKNLGTVCVPVVREVVSPAAFRNEDAEVTEIFAHGARRVRAVANKFKFGERRRGLQILRAMGAGGAMALNRTDFAERDKASKGYDLNTLVFGDSANRGKHVLPVKAGVQYSDAVSLAPYSSCVDKTFHNRAAEDGSLFDAEGKKNSNNLFERHFVVPGTVLLQVLTINGRTAPPEALLHLLACVGLAGAYGGQTSVYGVNVRNHVVGLFAAKMERPVASPYEVLAALGLDRCLEVGKAAGDAVVAVASVYREAYPVAVEAAEVNVLLDALVTGIERDDATLKGSYVDSHRVVGDFFDAWFGDPTAQPKARAPKPDQGALL